MTDNEIIKALECCVGDADGKDCVGCLLFEFSDCQEQLNVAALDLINRQKADIERLREINSLLTEVGQETQKRYEAAKAEALLEFAKRLKREKRNLFCAENIDGLIDNLVKEMVGEDNA